MEIPPEKQQGDADDTLQLIIQQLQNPPNFAAQDTTKTFELEADAIREAINKELPLLATPPPPAPLSPSLSSLSEGVAQTAPVPTTGGAHLVSPIPIHNMAGGRDEPPIPRKKTPRIAPAPPPASLLQASLSLNPQEQQDDQRSLMTVPSESLLLFLVLDYLKRRGLPATSASLLAELRVDPLGRDAAELASMVDQLSLLHGEELPAALLGTTGAGVGGGFLRDWWNSFWTSFQIKIRRASASGVAIPGIEQSIQQGPAKQSPVSTIAAIKPSSQPSLTQQQQQQQQQQQHYQAQLQYQQQKRAILFNNALLSLGLAGRDLRTLSPEENVSIS